MTHKYSFYRPHDRVSENNTMVDPFTGEVTHPPSMTKQEFKEECDINNILKQYSVTGMLNHVQLNAALGRYEDLPDEVDYQASLNMVNAANSSFESLPSKIRDRFGNDPVAFLTFCSDPSNIDEMRTLGIANPAPKADPTPQGGDGGQSPPS